jgi:hypothetical protein
MLENSGKLWTKTSSVRSLRKQEKEPANNIKTLSHLEIHKTATLNHIINQIDNKTHDKIRDKTPPKMQGHAGDSQMRSISTTWKKIFASIAATQAT